MTGCPGSLSTQVCTGKWFSVDCYHKLCTHGRGIDGATSILYSKLIVVHSNGTTTWYPVWLVGIEHIAIQCFMVCSWYLWVVHCLTHSCLIQEFLQSFAGDVETCFMFDTRLLMLAAMKRDNDHDLDIGEMPFYKSIRPGQANSLLSRIFENHMRAGGHFSYFIWNNVL